MKQTSPLRRTLALALLAAAVLTLLPSASAFFGSEVEDLTPPVVSVFAKNTVVEERIRFSPDDFLVDSEGDITLDSILIHSLPDPGAGVLTLGQDELCVGDLVSLTAVSGLEFRPLTTPTVPTTALVFTPVFSNGRTGAQASVPIHLLSTPNQAPIAQNLELSTYRDVAISDRFSATDPEGDLLTFRILDKPARGAVTFAEEGSAEFTYTPYQGKTGKDSFTYVAVDHLGEPSEPATVKVVIKKSNVKMTYADMAGKPAHKAAIHLAEKGVLVGECMGGDYFFHPDAAVSRGQFVAMAMAALELDPLDDVARTGFADDALIPTWAKPYLSSALLAGVIQGTSNSQGQIVFEADRDMTRAEASVLLDRMLRISDVSTEVWYADSSVSPAWAVQAAVNLETAGVLQTNSSGALALSDPLTRGNAAQMLSAALDVVAARDDRGWLFW